MFIYDLVTRIFLISLPEQCFVFLLSLCLFNKNNQSQLLIKKSRKKLISIVIFLAISSNVPKILSYDDTISVITNLFVVLTTLLIFEHKKNTGVGLWSAIKSIFPIRLILSFFVAYFSFVLSEALCVSAILYSVKITVNDLDKDVWLTFTVSLFERVFQYTLLYYIYSKKIIIGEKSIDLVGLIMTSRKKRKTTLVIIFILTIFLIGAGKVFMIDKIFAHYNAIFPLIMCTVAYSIPFIVVFCLLFFAKLCYLNNELYLKLVTDDVVKRANIALEIAIKEGDTKTATAIEDLLAVLNTSD